MKNSISSITLLLVLLYSFINSSAQNDARYTYQVEKVTTDVYVLKPVMHPMRWVSSNIILIVNPDDALVVDTGLLPSAGEAAIREIKKITNKPVRYIVNTHWHGDHWQGNEAFKAAYPAADFIAASRGADAINRNGMIWARQFYPKYLKMMIADYEAVVKSGKRKDGTAITEERLKNIRNGVDQVNLDIEEISKLKPVFPTLLVTDKLILKRGDREIQIHYLGIGNTIGDVVIYLPREKVLIPGDLVVYPSPFESGAFSKEWVDTSKKLKQFDFTYLIPGHGDVQQTSDYLDYLNALFDEVMKQMNTAYLSGKSTEEEVGQLVTHETVIKELAKNPKYIKFTEELDPGFVPASIHTTYSRVIEGKY